MFLSHCIQHAHNFLYLLDFQNYLRTQSGNNTTVNIIISTVDYLLRVQVSAFTLWCGPTVTHQAELVNGSFSY